VVELTLPEVRRWLMRREDSPFRVGDDLSLPRLREGFPVPKTGLLTAPPDDQPMPALAVPLSDPDVI
jgi:hypothetical protein